MYEKKYDQYPGYAMTLPARHLAFILQHDYIPYFDYRNLTSVSTQVLIKPLNTHILLNVELSILDVP